MEAKLRSYGDLRTLVFGAWGEASADVHSLVSALANVALSLRFSLPLPMCLSLSLFPPLSLPQYRPQVLLPIPGLVL